MASPSASAGEHNGDEKRDKFKTSNTVKEVPVTSYKFVLHAPNSSSAWIQAVTGPAGLSKTTEKLLVEAAPWITAVEVTRTIKTVKTSMTLTAVESGTDITLTKVYSEAVTEDILLKPMATQTPMNMAHWNSNREHEALEIALPLAFVLLVTLVGAAVFWFKRRRRINSLDSSKGKLSFGHRMLIEGPGQPPHRTLIAGPGLPTFCHRCLPAAERTIQRVPNKTERSPEFAAPISDLEDSSVSQPGYYPTTASNVATPSRANFAVIRGSDRYGNS